MSKRDILFLDSITDQIEYYLYRVFDGHVLSPDQKEHLRELRAMLVQHGFAGSGRWIKEIDSLLN